MNASQKAEFAAIEAELAELVMLLSLPGAPAVLGAAIADSASLRECVQRAVTNLRQVAQGGGYGQAY